MRKRIRKKKSYQVIAVVNCNLGDIVENFKFTPLQTKRLSKFVQRIWRKNKLIVNLNKWINRNDADILQWVQEEK